jgi:hypothetical protein
MCTATSACSVLAINIVGDIALAWGPHLDNIQHREHIIFRIRDARHQHRQAMAGTCGLRISSC